MRAQPTRTSSVLPPVGAPSYFHYFEAEDVGAGPETGQWVHTMSGDHIRLFAVGY